MSQAYFNPRARVGRDGHSLMIGPTGADFNPRARVGRDDEYDEGREAFDISIHAPAWGATS